MMSMCSQSAPCSWMTREHSEERLPKSEARIEGAIMGLGAIAGVSEWMWIRLSEWGVGGVLWRGS